MLIKISRLYLVDDTTRTATAAWYKISLTFKVRTTAYIYIYVLKRCLLAVVVAPHTGKIIKKNASMFFERVEIFQCTKWYITLCI